jgi:hypothetical protein
MKQKIPEGQISAALTLIMNELLKSISVSAEWKNPNTRTPLDQDTYLLCHRTLLEKSAKMKEGSWDPILSRVSTVPKHSPRKINLSLYEQMTSIYRENPPFISVED